MVEIQSKEVIDKISAELKIQPSMEIPRELNKNIQLVYNINSDNFIKNTDELTDSGPRTVTGPLTSFTTPINKDFFLTNVTASFIKDATCDSATGAYDVSIVVNGRVTSILSFPIITLLAQEGVRILYFNPSILIDRNTSIILNGVFTVGVCVRTLDVQGFTRDPQ